MVELSDQDVFELTERESDDEEPEPIKPDPHQMEQRKIAVDFEMMFLMLNALKDNLAGTELAEWAFSTLSDFAEYFNAEGAHGEMEQVVESWLVDQHEWEEIALKAEHEHRLFKAISDHLRQNGWADWEKAEWKADKRLNRMKKAERMAVIWRTEIERICEPISINPKGHFEEEEETETETEETVPVKRPSFGGTVAGNRTGKPIPPWPSVKGKDKPIVGGGVKPVPAPVKPVPAPVKPKGRGKK
jgi:hypothetical protein